MKNIITKTCSIKNDKITINGETGFTRDAKHDFSAFMKSAYKHYKISYPAFHKMDELSKLAFVTAELLMKNIDTLKYAPKKRAVILANSSSTISTDIKHFKTIRELDCYYPKPAVFVYTLPNIMIGELCIRHEFKGETALFVQQKYDREFITYYVNLLLDTHKVDCALTGYVDFNRNYLDNSIAYESTLYFVEKDKTINDNDFEFKC